MTALTSLLRACALALDPLRAALSDLGACQMLLRELGFTVSLSPTAHDRISTFLPIGQSLNELPELVNNLDNGINTATAVSTIAQTVSAASAAIKALADLEQEDLSDLPGTLSRPEAWRDIAETLPDHLLAQHLANDEPVLFLIFRLLGFCHAEGAGLTSRFRFRWDRLGTALPDPGSIILQNLGWGSAFQAWPLQQIVATTLSRLGFEVVTKPRQQVVAEALEGKTVTAPRGTETHITFYRGEDASGDGVSIGIVFAMSSAGGGRLYVSNVAYGAIGSPILLDEEWRIVATGNIDGTATIGIRLTPAGTELVGGELALGASVAFIGEPSSTPWILIGNADSSRVELGGARIEIGVEGSLASPEAYVRAAIEEGMLRFILDIRNGDSFLRGLLGDSLPSIETGGTLRWGSRTGLSLTGGVGFEVTIPLDKQIGPLFLQSIRFAISPRDGGFAIEGTATGSFSIGPLIATAENIGAAVALGLDTDGDTFAGLAADLRFVPPTGLGLGVDLEGIITGGGYLSIEDGRYAGVAALQMFGVGLTVIGIIETELPDDPNGWSMFLSVIADFTPVPLGFGFFLSGVGGFMGLHRTLDEIELAEGVRDGRIDSLLFPEDPLADAIRIISDIEDYFPTQQGTHAFGAMARIDWGVPALISAELGIVLVVPDFRIAVIGEIESILPVPEAPLLELHMGVVGYIDPAEATFWVTASIYDSRLVQYALSGDMAMYASLGDHPYFLLSVGGFHPDWTPPNYLPSTMRDLRRMTAAIDLGADLQVGLEAYFAITPNTLQFGAEVFAIAQMKKLGVDFRARGDFGFDVLVTFTPLSISADMDANVMIEAEGVPLVSARVEVHLEGPEPWFGRATATFEFLGQPIDFDVAFGGSIKDDAPDAIELWDQLEEALRLPESWFTPTIAASVTAEITLRPLDELTETGLWLAPDGALELRQRVLPLNREIEVFGAYVPESESRFDITGAGLVTGAAAERKSTEEWFAPAQFIDMSSLERLSAPSFEEMDAGMSLSASGVTVPTTQNDMTSVDLEYEELVLEDKTRKRERRALPIERFGLEPRFSTNRPGGPASRHTVSNLPSFRVKSTRYDVTNPYNASRIKRGGLYADAVVVRRTTSTAKSRARIMPTTAISEKVV